MKRTEYLRRSAEITRDWATRYADRIPSAYPNGSDPHGDQPTDYPVHHALMSAGPEHSDLLEEKLYTLTKEYQANPEEG